MWKGVICQLLLILLAWLPCQATSVEVLLILRFPTDDADNYVALVLEKKTPRAYGGQVQAFAKHNEVTAIQAGTASWPSDKALSVIYFPDAEAAKKWHRFAKDDIDQIWMESADVVLQELTAPLPDKEKTALLLIPTTISNTSAFFGRYVSMAKDIFVDSGGVMGASGEKSNQWKKLEGNWPVKQNNVYIHIAFMTNVKAAETFWASDEYKDALAVQVAASTRDVYAVERSVDLQGPDFGVYVILRLSMGKIDKYVNTTVAENTRRDHGGKVQVLAKEADDVKTLEGESWLSDKALSVVYFKSQLSARRWYERARNETEKSWADGVDVVLQPLTMELPPADKKGLLLSVSAVTNKDAFFTEYVPQFMKIFEEDKYGGTGGASGNTTDRWVSLQGSWPEPDSYLQIFHALSVDKLSDFWNSDEYTEGPKKLAEQSASSMDVYTMERHENLVLRNGEPSAAGQLRAISMATWTGLVLACWFGGV